MDAASIIILLLALLTAIALLRLVVAIRNSWDGDIEDLYEDVVIRRLVLLGVCIAILVAALLLRVPLETLFG